MGIHTFDPSIQERSHADLGVQGQSIEQALGHQNLSTKANGKQKTGEKCKKREPYASSRKQQNLSASAMWL